jgi:hypothetical protein
MLSGLLISAHDEDDGRGPQSLYVMLLRQKTLLIISFLTSFLIA